MGLIITGTGGRGAVGGGGARRVWRSAKLQMMVKWKEANYDLAHAHAHTHISQDYQEARQSQHPVGTQAEETQRQESKKDVKTGGTEENTRESLLSLDNLKTTRDLNDQE